MQTDLTDAILVGVKATMWRTDGANMEGALTDNRSAGESVSRMPAAEMLPLPGTGPLAAGGCTRVTLWPSVRRVSVEGPNASA